MKEMDSAKKNHSWLLGKLSTVHTSYSKKYVSLSNKISLNYRSVSYLNPFISKQKHEGLDTSKLPHTTKDDNDWLIL